MCIATDMLMMMVSNANVARKTKRSSSAVVVCCNALIAENTVAWAALPWEIAGTVVDPFVMSVRVILIAPSAEMLFYVPLAGRNMEELVRNVPVKRESLQAKLSCIHKTYSPGSK